MKVTGKQFTLGQLINALEHTPNQYEHKDIFVTYDFCHLWPSKLRSYRGYYEDLAFGFGSYSINESRPPTVKEFRQDCKDAIGKEFEGYKGGQYKAGNNTALWVANYGETTCTIITGIHLSDRGLILHTDFVEH